MTAVTRLGISIQALIEYYQQLLEEIQHLPESDPGRKRKEEKIKILGVALSEAKNLLNNTF